MPTVRSRTMGCAYPALNSLPHMARSIDAIVLKRLQCLRVASRDGKSARHRRLSPRQPALDAVRVDDCDSATRPVSAVLDHGCIPWLCRLALHDRKAPPHAALEVASRRAGTVLLSWRAVHLLINQWCRTGLGIVGHYGCAQAAGDAQTPRSVRVAFPVDFSRDVIAFARAISL